MKVALMIRFLAVSALILTMQTAAVAQSVAPVDTLFRALGLPEIIEIMREEGIAYGTDLDADLFEGRGGVSWAAVVEEIYDLQRMTDTVRNRMDAELAAEDLSPMIGFFMSDRGRRIVQLEISARRAQLDKRVEAASRDALAAMVADNDPRFGLLEEFAEVSELIDSNVVGAMNSNYAFYVGLTESGAFSGEMTEEEILSDVWSQEDAIRLETEDWLYAYLALAYQPLSDDDLQTYTAFFRTREGTVLNRAIFTAFDEMFVAVSLALGRGASRFLAGQEL